MHRPNPHPNDRDYDWGPADPIDNPVPSDLAQYHRQFKPGYWGYVCPCCKLVFAPGWAGMPDALRSHIRLKNTPKTSDKHADQAANF